MFGYEAIHDTKLIDYFLFCDCFIGFMFLHTTIATSFIFLK